MAAACASPVGVPALGMGQGEQTHKCGEICLAPRPQHQVPVIGHEAVSQDSHPDAFPHLAQDAFKGLIVLIRLEDGLARVGAIERVINQPADAGAKRSSNRLQG